MRSRQMIRFLAPSLLIVAACSGDSGSSPTAPSIMPAATVVSSAKVVVDGRDVSGMNVPQGHHGAVTHFEARVEHDGSLEPGFEMWMRYEQPEAHGMMGTQGRARLFDDGTHGDPVAGDGIYCLDDDIGQIGCQRSDAPMGEYHYDFYGAGPHGDETNHCLVTVTVVGG